ncbi:hypothetical protein Tco_1352654 [Tanacetum coccineum]
MGGGNGYIVTHHQSPLSSWSSPLPHIPFPPLPPIPSPPLPVSSPVPMLSPSPPVNPIRQLGYRAAMIRLRAEAASTSHSLLLPPPIILSHTRPDAPSSGTPPLHLLFTDRRADRPEVTLPPRRSLGIALGPGYEVRESSSAAAARMAGGLRADYGFVATIDREIRRDLERDVGYGITNSWDEIFEAMQGTPVVIDVAEFSQRMIEFEIRVRQDTDEIYTRCGWQWRWSVVAAAAAAVGGGAEVRDEGGDDVVKVSVVVMLVCVVVVVVDGSEMVGRGDGSHGVVVVHGMMMVAAG